MANLMIQQIWKDSYEEFLNSGQFLSDVQQKSSRAIVHCKSGALAPMPASVPSADIRNSTIIPAVTGTAQTARLS